MKKLFIVFALIFTATAAQAVEKRYVTDSLWLQLRSGPGQEYRILKALQSGEHLIFIEENADVGYTKVRTDKGLEGWVLTRFLVDEPVAKEKLILANRELEKVKAELETTKTQKAEYQAEVEKLKSERSGLGRENTDLEDELNRIKTISENALALDEKVKKLGGLIARRVFETVAEDHGVKNGQGLNATQFWIAVEKMKSVQLYAK